jgi:hypothetical protein
MEIVQFALETLANSMRIYAVNSANFHHLLSIDSEEAINNLDRSFEAKLEAFHSVYDVTTDKFNYFDHADTALLIIIRNAIHHRSHLLFRSWNSEMHLNGGMKRYSGATFLFVNHTENEVAKYSEYYLKISDIYERISTSNSVKNKENIIKLIENDLKLHEAVGLSASEGYPLSQVYLNIIPIFVTAMHKLFEHVKTEGVVPKGFDSELYRDHFACHLPLTARKMQYKSLRIP